MQIELSEAIKAVPLVAPLIGAVVDTWLKPKLAKMKEAQDLEIEFREDLVSSKFEEYLLRAYEKQSHLATVVFKDPDKLLKDLYIPLTVRPISRREEEEKSSFKLDDYPQGFLPELRRVLVIDDAGMGKSTLSRFLFLRCIDTNAGIPIFLDLRQMNAEKSVLDMIFEALNALHKEMHRDFVLALINRGNFVFFFDGYDEIPFSDRKEATLALQDFVSKAGENLFILTSRPDPALSSFASFHSYSIQPLETEEAFTLLRKYGQNNELSEQLIDELNTQLSSVEEFLSNPMLVSLLFRAYEYKQKVPLKRHVFYRQVFDALFDAHDATKPLFKRPKHSGLDIDDFERVLRVLGYITVAKGKVAYTKDEVLGYIRQAEKSCVGLSFGPTKFLEDLLQTVPLFARDGNYYRWKHKSIQEYFAALYICLDTKEKQADILRRLTSRENSDSYRNLLSLCYDLDYETFRNTLIYDLISKFVAYNESSYTEIDRTLISEKDIRQRKMAHFGKKTLLFPHQFFEDNDIKVDKKTPHWEFDAMREHSKHLKFDIEGLESYALLHFNGGGVQSWYIDILSINQILLDKGEELFEEILTTQVEDENRKTRLQRRLKRDVLPNDICSNSQPIILDDTAECPLNQVTNFKLTTSVIAADPRTKGIGLSINKCRKLLASIEADFNRQRSGNDIADLI